MFSASLCSAVCPSPFPLSLICLSGFVYTAALSSPTKTRVKFLVMAAKNFVTGERVLGNHGRTVLPYLLTGALLEGTTHKIVIHEEKTRFAFPEEKRGQSKQDR